VRLLARGALKAPLKFKVAGASEAAVKAVEAAGGSVESYNPEEGPAGWRRQAGLCADALAQPSRESRLPKSA